MNLEKVRELDLRDPLASHRSAFVIPEGKVYLDGNSLGALPRSVVDRVQKTVESEWGKSLIGSWNEHDWIDLPSKVGEKIAPLLGAAPGQVIACDSISVNLFKLLSFALELNPSRRKILSQEGNFPTDLYIAQGLEHQLGSSRCQLQPVSAEELRSTLDESVAVLFLTHVDFRSGRVHDMAELTARAHECGALVLWDLAHSAGAMPLELDACEVDLAVGCGYKYLNGGPGAPSFVYVAKRHQGRAQQPLTGWMGHSEPFAFDGHYRGGTGVQQFLSGTPGVLSMSALDAALDLFADVDLEVVRRKSIELGSLVEELVAGAPELADLRLASPTRKSERGSQLAFQHDHAYEVCQALIARDVITDFRAPDLLRVGFTPLYTRFEDGWLFVEALREVVGSGEYRESRFSVRSKVT